MSRRLLFLAVLVLVGLGLLWFLSGGRHGEGSGAEVVREAPAPVAGEPLAGESAPERHDEVLTPRFLDRWSGEEVPAEEVALVTGSGDRLPAATEIPLRVLEADGAHWAYEVPSPDGPVAAEVSVAESRSEQPGTFVLPRSPRLEVRVREPNQGEPVSGAEVRFAFLQAEGLRKAEVRPEEALQPVPRQTYASLMSRYKQEVYGVNLLSPRSDEEAAEEALGWMTAEEVEGEPGLHRLTPPMVGEFVFTVRKEGWFFDWGRGEVGPGDVFTGEAEIGRRAVLFGTIYDADGRPLPEARFNLITIPTDGEPPEVDWEGFDGGMGNMGIKTEDGVWHRVLVDGIYTDDEGRYRVHLPPGRRYALEARHDDQYAFAEVPSAATVPGAEVEQDLHLAPPEGGVTFRFLDETGLPIPNLGVEPLGISDIPWMRQLFPRQVTDEKGEIRVPWFHDGESVGFYLYPGNGEAGSFSPVNLGPDRIILQPGRTRYEVHLPKGRDYWSTPYVASDDDERR